ncbi:putative gustatory receptor 58c isoform X1 [Drosophila serrata]|uniref:putative gustatory receptor 58c isoform X1 n=1 Tax=Drosophila serrata TaxID=7274 RepID=UPI000A1D138E|nr:putative gustatory receptor 58c isoform X1 [Drosophila serrata]
MVELSLLRLYFEVSRLIGLSNLHYSFKERRFVLNHVPTVLYCLLLNVTYLLILPFALFLLTGNIYECPDKGMFGVVYNVVGLAELFTFVLLIGSTWIQRCRLQRLGNDLMGMLHRFRFALGNDCRKKTLWKVLLTSSRFMLLTQQLVARDSVVHCEVNSKLRKTLLPYYRAAIVYSQIMLLLVIYVDLTVYMVQVSGNWLLTNMTQKVEDMIQDLKALPQRGGLPREMALRQILPAWRRLWRRCLHLDSVLRELLEVFQWQILFNLLTIYIFNLAALFRLWIYLSFDKNYNVYKGIVYSILFLTHHLELLMHFSVFETNRSNWLELWGKVVKLWYTNYSGDGLKNRHGVMLSRQLEISLFYLNRKLQLHPQRVRRLHIAGLFDISKSSIHQMTRSLITNVMVLYQIAYKIYG